MLSDQFYDVVGLVGLQKLLQDVSPIQVLVTLLAIVVAGIAVDYARMLWLRSKMVRDQSARISFQMPDS